MRNSGGRFITDTDMIHSEQFTDMCRGNRANVFVRNRKMPVSDLVFSMINRKGLTLKMELRGYMNISHPGTQISKPGYLKQRMKLNPEAIKYLYQFHNNNKHFGKKHFGYSWTFSKNGYFVRDWKTNAWWFIPDDGSFSHGSVIVGKEKDNGNPIFC